MEIAGGLGIDGAEVLNNIFHQRVFNTDAQCEIVKHIAAACAENPELNHRLVIFDSIIHLFRTEFSGRGELAERQQKLAQHLADISRLAGARFDRTEGGKRVGGR